MTRRRRPCIVEQRVAPAGGPEVRLSRTRRASLVVIAFLGATTAASCSGDGSSSSSEGRRDSGADARVEGGVDARPSSDARSDAIISVPTANPCADGCVVETVAGSGAADFADGPGSTSAFNRPAGLAIDQNGTVYVADERNHRVRFVSPGAGGDATVSTLAGSGTQGLADGAPQDAAFSSPRDVAVDSSGAVYVADATNHRIRKIENNQVTTFAGSGPTGTLVGEHADGSALNARFNGPSGVAVGPEGRVHVADTENHALRIIDNGFVSTIGVPGVAGHVDGPPNVARFDSPSGVAVADDGTVYVADRGNHRIRRMRPGGPVETIAGSGAVGASEPGGFADGPASSAELAAPWGIGVDGAARVYVADSGNHRLRLIRSDGGPLVVETLAGSGSAGGWQDGAADQALFLSPRGVARDSMGNLYVGDSDNHRIRVIRPAG